MYKNITLYINTLNIYKQKQIYRYSRWDGMGQAKFTPSHHLPKIDPCLIESVKQQEKCSPSLISRIWDCNTFLSTRMYLSLDSFYLGVMPLIFIQVSQERHSEIDIVRSIYLMEPNIDVCKAESNPTGFIYKINK